MCSWCSARRASTPLTASAHGAASFSSELRLSERVAQLLPECSPPPTAGDLAPSCSGRAAEDRLASCKTG